MADEAVIKYDKAKYEECLKHMTDMLSKGQEIAGHFTQLYADTLERGFMGKKFYIGEQKENMINYYQSYLINIQKLNSLYAKAHEYLFMTGNKLAYTDEELAKLILTHLEEKGE